MMRQVLFLRTIMTVTRGLSCPSSSSWNYSWEIKALLFSVLLYYHLFRNHNPEEWGTGLTVFKMMMRLLREGLSQCVQVMRVLLVVHRGMHQVRPWGCIRWDLSGSPWLGILRSVVHCYGLFQSFEFAKLTTHLVLLLQALLKFSLDVVDLILHFSDLVPQLLVLIPQRMHLQGQIFLRPLLYLLWMW